jgi:UDP-glucose 4-epimerase
MKTLVTGGAGFIGSHLVDELINLGHEVICIDNESADSNEKFYWNPKAKNYFYDISDYYQIEYLFHEVDVVFHMASIARVQPSIIDSSKIMNADINGTYNILEASKKHNVKRVVFSSTSSAYGNNKLPNVETQKEDCLSPYSAAKVFGENLLKIYHDLYSMKTISLRYFNVYGERQPLKGMYAPVIGLFLKQNENAEPLTIVGDGMQKRDFTHVKDVVNANILAATKEVDDSCFGQVYNVGSGYNKSILHLAWMISSQTVHLPSRPGEAKETLSNSNKFKSTFVWEPKINLNDWIKSYIDKSKDKDV